MKNLKTITLFGFISIFSLFIASCSDEAEKQTSKKENSGDHVWKTQTDALQSAKDMAKKMQESLNQQQEKMDENN